MWVGFNYAFSRQAWSFWSAQVLAHEVRPRIGRPRQQGQAGGIGSMAYEAMARNCSEKKLNSGKIAATLARAGQIVQRKSIDEREQTLVTEENPPSSLLGRSQLENLHLGHRSTNRSQPPQCAEEYRAQDRERKGPRQAQRGEDRCNFKPRRTDHTKKEHRPTGADSGHGGGPPVLSPWSVPTGELTPWPPQHRSKPTGAMRRGAPGRKPTGGRPAYGATPSNTA